jgi:hypothetical protein
MTTPRVLRAYLNLELIAELGGDNPDTFYLQRIYVAAADAHQLLDCGWQPASPSQAVQSEVETMRASAGILESENEVALEEAYLRLQRLQNELKQICRANREKEITIGLLQQNNDAQAAKLDALEADKAELKRERNVLARDKDVTLQTVIEIKQQLSAQAELLRQVQRASNDQLAKMQELEAEKRQALEQSDLTLLQIHQLQEELELYFLKARAAHQLAEAQQQQLHRAQSLIARLLEAATNTHRPLPAVAVKVLPPMQASLKDPDQQTSGLLSSYASSLRRGRMVLKRRFRP